MNSAKIDNWLARLALILSAGLCLAWLGGWPLRAAMLAAGLTLAGVSVFVLQRRRRRDRLAVQRYFIEAMCRLGSPSSFADPSDADLPPLPPGNQWSGIAERMRDTVLRLHRRVRELEQTHSSLEVRCRRAAAQAEQMRTILSGLADPILVVDDYDEIVLGQPQCRRTVQHSGRQGGGQGAPATDPLPEARATLEFHAATEGGRPSHRRGRNRRCGRTIALVSGHRGQTGRPGRRGPTRRGGRRGRGRAPRHRRSEDAAKTERRVRFGRQSRDEDPLGRHQGLRGTAGRRRRRGRSDSRGVSRRHQRPGRPVAAAGGQPVELGPDRGRRGQREQTAAVPQRVAGRGPQRRQALGRGQADRTDLGPQPPVPGRAGRPRHAPSGGDQPVVATPSSTRAPAARSRSAAAWSATR